MMQVVSNDRNQSLLGDDDSDGNVVDNNNEQIISLCIEIISARGLLVSATTTDNNADACSGNTPDPFVKVIMGGKQLHQTKPIFTNFNPVYSKATQSSFVFDCTESELIAANGLKFILKDWDGNCDDDLDLGDSDLGDVHVPAETVINLNGEPREYKIIPPRNRSKEKAGYLKLQCHRATPEDRERYISSSSGSDKAAVETKKSLSKVIERATNFNENMKVKTTSNINSQHLFNNIINVKEEKGKGIDNNSIDDSSSITSTTETETETETSTTTFSEDFLNVFTNTNKITETTTTVKLQKSKSVSFCFDNDTNNNNDNNKIDFIDDADIISEISVVVNGEIKEEEEENSESESDNNSSSNMSQLFLQQQAKTEIIKTQQQNNNNNNNIHPDDGLQFLMEIISCQMNSLLVTDDNDTDTGIGFSENLYVKVSMGSKYIHQTEIIETTNLNPKCAALEIGSVFAFQCTAKQLFGASGLILQINNFDLIGKDGDDDDFLGSVHIGADVLCDMSGYVFEFEINPHTPKRICSTTTAGKELRTAAAGFIKIRCCAASVHDLKKFGIRARIKAQVTKKALKASNTTHDDDDDDNHQYSSSQESLDIDNVDQISESDELFKNRLSIKQQKCNNPSFSLPRKKSVRFSTILTEFCDDNKGSNNDDNVDNMTQISEDEDELSNSINTQLKESDLLPLPSPQEQTTIVIEPVPNWYTPARQMKFDNNTGTTVTNKKAIIHGDGIRDTQELLETALQEHPGICWVEIYDLELSETSDDFRLAHAIANNPNIEKLCLFDLVIMTHLETNPPLLEFIGKNMSTLIELEIRMKRIEKLPYPFFNHFAKSNIDSLVFWNCIFEPLHVYELNKEILQRKKNQMLSRLEFWRCEIRRNSSNTGDNSDECCCGFGSFAALIIQAAVKGGNKRKGKNGNNNNGLQRLVFSHVGLTANDCAKVKVALGSAATYGSSSLQYLALLGVSDVTDAILPLTVSQILRKNKILSSLILTNQVLESDEACYSAYKGMYRNYWTTVRRREQKHLTNTKPCIPYCKSIWQSYEAFFS